VGRKYIILFNEDWDDETGTVRAETRTNAALEAAERFPHKRLVVHYMQPHYPFVPVTPLPTRSTPGRSTAATAPPKRTS
jgi:hypothetical protein